MPATSRLAPSVVSVPLCFQLVFRRSEDRGAEATEESPFGRRCLGFSPVYRTRPIPSDTALTVAMNLSNQSVPSNQHAVIPENPRTTQLS